MMNSPRIFRHFSISFHAPSPQEAESWIFTISFFQGCMMWGLIWLQPASRTMDTLLGAFYVLCYLLYKEWSDILVFAEWLVPTDAFPGSNLQPARFQAKLKSQVGSECGNIESLLFLRPLQENWRVAACWSGRYSRTNRTNRTICLNSRHLSLPVA